MRLAGLTCALALGPVACDGCDAEASHDEHAAAIAAPEPWTLGAARGDVVLPPPCRPGESPLAAVMARSTRVAAVPGVVDHVIAVEGVLETTRGRPRWIPDAAGVMTMAHGRGEAVTPLPWSPGARAARSESGWLVALPRDETIALWHEGEAHAGWKGTLVDLRCAGAICGLLSQDERPVLHYGGAPERWREVVLPSSLRALSIAGASANGLVVALSDDLRVRFFETRDEAATALAALEAPDGALAAVASPPSALVRGGYDAAGCQNQAGGVVLVSERGTLPLRSAFPPREAALVALADGGLFAAWLAPVRCGATAHALHAAVIAPDGSLAGPVTTVAEADGFAIASAADRVSLWLEERGAAAGRGTITFIPMRCALGGDP